jgi:protein TonB
MAAHSGVAPRDASLLERSLTLAFVVALHVLLLFMLLRLAPLALPPPAAPGRPITVDLLPEAPVAPERTRTAEKARKRGGEARPAVAPVAPPDLPAAPPPPLPPASSGIWSQVVPLTRQDMAAGDIARFPSRPSAQPGAGAADRGNAEGEDEGDTAGPGRGPNGEKLYNAQWYRTPTRAELSTYLPAGAPREGWGIIACRTVANYRVEDCIEIAQSPPGSGLSRAVRQAAWQFRVFPPRIGGRKLVGAWVRIRIDYSVTAEE